MTNCNVNNSNNYEIFRRKIYFSHHNKVNIEQDILNSLFYLSMNSINTNSIIQYLFICI